MKTNTLSVLDTKTQNTIYNSPLLEVVFISKTMMLRFKKDEKIVVLHPSKEQFLKEHNRLSPASLKATDILLSRFKLEKPSLFKNNDWSIEKLRRPFLLWLTSL